MAAEADRRQSDPAAGAEDDQLVAGLQSGDRAEDVVRRPPGHPEGGGVVVVDTRRHGPHRRRRHGHLLGEGAHQHRAGHPVTDRQSPATPSATSSTTPTNSLPGTNGGGTVIW